jgi:hypothetical protein
MTRRDRTGEPIDEDELPLEALGPHRCSFGWLDDDPDTGKPRPCLVCKPPLAGRPGAAWRAPQLTDQEWNG